jgi:AAA domain
VSADLGGLGKRYTRQQLAELPAVESLIDDVMSRPAAVVLVGAYGLGKSALVQAWLGCVATGTAWLGHAVRQQRRCLYAVGEGAYGLDARLSAWERQTGQKIGEDELTVLVQPGSLLAKPTWQALGTEAIDCGLVVLDTFSSLAPDADETKDAAQIMRHCANLAALIEGTVLLVHHPGWSDAGRARGGYQLEANADEVLILAGEEGAPHLELTRKKVKDGPDGGKLWLARRPAHGSVVIETARLDEIDAPLKLRVFEALRMTGDIGLSAAQIHKDLGGQTKVQSVHRVLREMRDTSLAVEFVDRGVKRYRLPLLRDETEA